MPNKPREGTTRIGLTIPLTIKARAEQEAERLRTEMGLMVDAADVIRAVLEKHLPPLEGTPGEKPAKKAAKKRG